VKSLAGLAGTWFDPFGINIGSVFQRLGIIAVMTRNMSIQIDANINTCILPYPAIATLYIRLASRGWGR